MIMGRRAQLRLLAVALLLLLPVLAACGTEPQSILDPKSNNAREIHNLGKIFYWSALAVFVLVEGALVYTIIRYRQSKNPEPFHIHGNTKVEIAWTIAPAILVAFLAIMTYSTQAKITTFPENPFVVRAIGHQWWWEFEYPELGISTAGDMYIPAGRDIKVELQSKDVVHSFWVPKLMGKTDTLPGLTNYLWFNAEEPGEYYGQCAEFCGEQHALMRFKVIARPQAEFDAWAAAMKEPPPAPPQSAGLCLGCHTFDATKPSTVGPNLRNFGSRAWIAAGALENTPEHLAAWLHNPEAVKPGNLMSTVVKPGVLTDAQIQELVTYLERLKVE
ncbi:MAG: cytochrome c oxidase subunit 2 [Herpetosiphonaceae bacterium]|nr:MAG: cytochrome c oxidase subunit 2 [Herpetosiphonaceae bacterium]